MASVERALSHPWNPTSQVTGTAFAEIMGPVIVLCCVLALVAAEPTVEGPLGKISGKINNILDVDIEAFLGIPFAKPPEGELRFALPQPFGPVGDLQADKYGSACPQRPILVIGTASEDEDCLFLNVYRKSGTTKDDRKAVSLISVAIFVTLETGCHEYVSRNGYFQVIAIVHGGGYISGSASDVAQSAEPLAGIGDVIVVNFNYRLGIFGFADMNGLAPANLGLHDQRLALKWIQDHIADFGGDPERVTIVGLSAGSMSVAAQIISTADKNDLFQAAVLDAGVAASHGFLEAPESSFSRVKKVTEAIGCSSDNILECLRKAPAGKLISESHEQSGTSGLKNFVPTADGVFLPKDAQDYIAKNPADLRKVRTMVGYSRDEGSLFVGLVDPLFNFTAKKTDDEILDYIEKISRRYNFPFDASQTETRQKLRQVYIGEHGNAFKAVQSLIADGWFKCPINAFIKQYSRHNDKVFAYQFERILSRTYYKAFNPKVLGAFHISAYLHFSGALFLDGEAVPDVDKQFSLDTMNLISNFAKSDGTLEFRGVEWPSYSKAGEVFIFDDKPSLRKELASVNSCREVFPGDE